MKPKDTEKPDGLKPHSSQTLRDQLLTTVRLFTIAGALLLALWLVDQMVTG